MRHMHGMAGGCQAAGRSLHPRGSPADCRSLLSDSGADGLVASTTAAAMALPRRRTAAAAEAAGGGSAALAAPAAASARMRSLSRAALPMLLDMAAKSCWRPGLLALK